ncbi:MAG: DUF308 domain-containing protein [Christensenellaceae bacterium]|jgi:uncharacterized membrane protein HdeD (DUF308 family)
MTAKSGTAFTLILNIILFIVGIALIMNPAEGMAAIILILGIIMIVYGAVMIAMNVNRINNGQDGSSVVLPVVVLVVGILFIIFRGATANIILPLVVGIWAIVTGIVSLMDAMKVRHASGNWRPMAYAALAAIVLGVIIIIGMVTGGNTVGTLLGVCLLIFAVVGIVQWFLTYAARKNNYL